MQIIVDQSKCQNHGLCAISAPDHFELDADGNLQYEKSYEEDASEEVEDAVDSCPLQAIGLSRDAA
ncbi:MULTISPECIES: ferredoxin [Streptomyces]|uniref:ferredoxin n=1 Tax=Streptomyces TaxID=1883 RepID=UPI001A99F36D|nr:ferredoxin [Streptomyces sp. CA-256286]QTA36817.1 ferredoxin [Streptomyces sp. CA-256286]